MRAFQLQGFGLDQVRAVELPDPVPGAGEILVRVRAASLNRRDLVMALGRYDRDQPLPLIPVSDGAGDVAAVGAGVTRVHEGDRVAGIFAQKWLAGTPTAEMLGSTLGGPLPGMMAESAVLAEEGVVRIPGHLSYEEAATLPCAAVTAWSSLISEGGLRPGETVLVEGTGGVALFALQFACLAGARVLVLSSSDARLQRALALGAWKGINYREHEDWERMVLKETGGRGVDHVMETGGAATLPRAIRATAMGGRIWVIGFLSGNQPPLDLFTVLRRKVQIRGVFAGHRESFEAMNRAIDAAGMFPVVDRVYEFEEFPQALAALRDRERFGKTVIRL